jgi:hypothetical protein
LSAIGYSWFSNPHAEAALIGMESPNPNAGRKLRQAFAAEFRRKTRLIATEIRQ